MSTTPSTIALSELAAKGADADFIKQTLQFALQRLMDMDVETLCKAAYGERSEHDAVVVDGCHRHPGARCIAVDNYHQPCRPKRAVYLRGNCR